MPTATCNGIELYYEVHGTGEPLLCVMGLAADTRGWVFNVPAFADRHRTIIFDNRDVGRSGYVDGPYEVSDMAIDTLALADHLELARFHLLGVSLGGTISTEVALAAPERVRTLTLAASWGGGGRWWRVRGRQLHWLSERSTEELIDQLLVINLSEELWEDECTIARARKRMLEAPYGQQPEGFRRQAEAQSRHEARDRLAQLRMPVHVIGAEHDVLVPVWKSRELAELIPGATLTIIPRAPHGMNTERAGEFNQAALGFIAEHAVATPP